MLNHRFRGEWLCALALGSVVLACSDDKATGPANNGKARSSGVLTVHNGGFLDIKGADGKAILKHAWAEAEISTNGVIETFSTKDCPGSWGTATAPADARKRFESMTGFAYHCATRGIDLTWTVLQHPSPAETFVVATLVARNDTDSDVIVRRLTPAITGGATGGLFVGANASRTRVLDNGSDIAIDFVAGTNYPGSLRFLLLDGFDIAPRGNIVSNWNVTVADLDSNASFTAGTLEVERAFPTMGVAFDSDYPARDGDRQGLNEFIADMPLIFQGKVLAPAEELPSEALYMNSQARDFWTSQEDYAQTLADWQDFTVWTKRDGGRPTPNGWNSWTGSGSTGGLGTNIDETILAENLDVMAREFGPFGVDYFQIDDGYEIREGDWFTRDDRFPSGMPDFASKIEATGLIPGIWFSPFSVDVESSLALEHPDWIFDPETAALGGLLDPGDGLRVLDASNDEAVAWLRSTVRRYVDDWKMKWLKLDFSYYALVYPPLGDPSLTSVEAYKRGLRAIGDEAGDDVFYLGIGILGINFGVVDSMRTTLDSAPLWDESEGAFATLSMGNSIKGTVRSSSRRYYLHNRIWVNHNDLLFFRSDKSFPDKLLTQDEAITFASFMGLSGSIVKFGEDLRTLTPEQINIWRTLTPSYPDAARPMDVLTRQYPEQYRLDIDGTLAGSDAKWLVVGLLHWGTNYGLDTDNPTTLSDEAREYTIDIETWGLDPEKEYVAHEFWSQAFLGKVKGTFTYTVAPHRHAVVSLREVTGNPQFLGHNRHLTQGGTDLVSETWSAETKTLTVTLRVDAAAVGAVSFPYAISVYVPEGYTFSAAAPDSGVAEVAGARVTYRFTPETAGEMTFEFSFE